MDSQLFFLLNFVVAGIFLLWFFSGRKGEGRRPTQLDLNAEFKAQSTLQKDIVKAGREMNTQPPSKVADPFEKIKTSEGNYGAKSDFSEGHFRDVTHTRSTAENVIKTQQKRVLFIYNGHDWDAYEVLGVGPSSTLPDITKKYQEMIRNADQGQIEFLEVAYKALLKKF